MADEYRIKMWSERWRLAVLDPPALLRLGLMAVIVGLVYVLYQFFGNTANYNQVDATRSAFTWLFRRWSDSAMSFGGGDYSHGWLIPVASLWIVWMIRHKLADAPRRTSRVGLALVVLALGMAYFGAKGEQTRVSLTGLILLLWGIPFYLFGWPTAKLLMFPCAYLMFSLPYNFLDNLTFPLRMISTTFSVGVLNGLGLAVEQSGTAIYSREPGGFIFDVADPCSGIRSIQALTALTAIYAYLSQDTLLKKWVLFLASIPIAILGNATRIVTIGLVAQAFGQKLAVGLWHDYSGYIFFTVAILLMIGISRLVSVDYPDLARRLRHAASAPSPAP